MAARAFSLVLAMMREGMPAGIPSLSRATRATRGTMRAASTTIRGAVAATPKVFVVTWTAVVATPLNRLRAGFPTISTGLVISLPSNLKGNLIADFSASTTLFLISVDSFFTVSTAEPIGSSLNSLAAASTIFSL